MKTLSVGVVIPTFNGAKHLPFCLPPLLDSSLRPEVLVVDSSSEDNTVAIAQAFGAQTLVIPRSEFNHGATREMARHYLKSDIVVMMTQDAYAVDNQLLSRLIAPLQLGQASVSYARQLPHLGADAFEAFPRHFNYTPESQLRSLKDLSNYGVYTFFCSNSCAAYLNSALDSIGGLKPVSFGEDTLAVAELLHQGHKVAYVADAIVRHSHRHSLREEFKRHVLIGRSRRKLLPLLSGAGSDERRGMNYLQEFTKHLWTNQRSLLPYAYLQMAVKWFGYRLGRGIF